MSVKNPICTLDSTQEIDVEHFMEDVMEFVSVAKIGNISIHVTEDGVCTCFIKNDGTIFHARREEKVIATMFAKWYDEIEKETRNEADQN